MRYTPKSELEVMNVLPAEKHVRYKVVAQKEGTSKSSGNPMISLTLSVTNSIGKTNRNVFVHLLTIESMEWLLRHFIFSNKLAARYNTGSISGADCMDQEGYCDIDIEEAKAGARAKNVIVDFCMPDGSEEHETMGEDPQQQSNPNDDIPF